MFTSIANYFYPESRDVGHKYTVNDLPLDVLRIVWAMCPGSPIRFVCRKWAAACMQRRIYIKHVSSMCMYKWMMEGGYKNSDYTYHLLAFGGHLNLLKWLRGGKMYSLLSSITTRTTLSNTSYTPFSIKECMYGAAAGGHLDILKWLAGESRDRPPSYCATMAARYGHLHILKWMFAPTIAFPNDAMSHAARGGHLHIIKWIRGWGYKWSGQEAENAAMGGHLETLKWLFKPENKYYIRIYETACAATCHGHLHILKWLKEECGEGSASTYTEKPEPFGVDDYDYVANFAARHGHIHILEWLREMEYVLPSDCGSSAANSGHFDILEKLYEWKVHLDPYAYIAAYAGDRVGVLGWLYMHGCKWHDDLISHFVTGGNLRLIKWARSRGCPWGNASVNSAKVWATPEVVEYLRTNGCPETLAHRGPYA